MKIGITVRFQNSYFSGGLPQVACALGRALQHAGHSVTLVYPTADGDRDWFVDVRDYAALCPERRPVPTVAADAAPPFDVVVEVVWPLSVEERARMARNVVMFVHKPPIFHDMESSAYRWNPAVRTFTGVSAIWTYDLYSKHDIQYLAFLSGVPVYQVPYVWDPDALDVYTKEVSLPAWAEGARASEAAFPAGVPAALSWSARIVESNFSNTSHCIIPLSIVSELRQRGTPIRWAVHNGEPTAAHPFFQSNVVKNLALPDWKECMAGRVRLPDFMREKTCILAHQRWRPLKSFLLDALYLGIPMVHNCTLLKSMGAPYWYELNQIQQATEAWRTMMSDYAEKRGFFQPKADEVRKTALRARFAPAAVATAYADVLKRPMTPAVAASAAAPVLTLHSPSDKNVLRVAFCNMWAGFAPRHNFFLYLLAWVGAQVGVRVVLDEENPTVVFYGPLSSGAEKRYAGIPKVYYTGENAPPSTDPDVFLNLGFQHRKEPGYIRLPLWVLEVNWFGGNVDAMANPKPVSVAAATAVPSAELLSGKSKFCAFVASNPNNPNRNTAFQILNNWRRVDAAGRLFCNMPRKRSIPGGPGGGGGELAKVEFYKQYRFVLTYENGSAPGYTTEKLFHAKVAGAVPIYWGDPFVDRDFDPRGFLNANQVATPEDLINLVKKLEDDPAAWREAAAVPAISPEKRKWCEDTMANVARHIFKTILSREVSPAALDWSRAESFAASYTPEALPAPAPVSPKIPVTLAVTAATPVANGRRVFVTAATMPYIESAANALSSMRAHHPTTDRIVYVWPDVTEEARALLRAQGATVVREFPTQSVLPWTDFWNPAHFAWKLWLLRDALAQTEEGTALMYGDAGALWVHSAEPLWRQIDDANMLLFDDASQPNRRWCHPDFCRVVGASPEELQAHQLWAGVLGLKAGSQYVASVVEKAYTLASAHREAIVGEKWARYSEECLGHRHDQSILSILTQRAGVPRLPISEYYTDISMQHATMNKKILYVHRGTFKERPAAPFAPGLDEAYVVNLERRKDRMDTFCASVGPQVAASVLRWNAVDGRTLRLTPQLAQLFRDNDFRWKKSVMGCALSHLSLWERMAREGRAKRILVLEDDVRFVDGWQERWAAMVPHIPADADVIYLGGVLPPNKVALPACTEAVNAHFARVAKNTVFSGGNGPARRYFHFCTYAYVLTQSGLQKMLSLVQQRGIFTSVDHMLVNHGDGYLNIYFTTPLLATCFQEDDPVYQKAEFNNFQRVDNFDSDLWNNTDRFTEEEVRTAVPAVAAAVPVEVDLVWNTFLRGLAERDTKTLHERLHRVLDTLGEGRETELCRRFAQIVNSKHPLLLEHGPSISERLRNMPGYDWSATIAALSEAPAAPAAPAAQRIYIVHEYDPASCMEREWLETLFGKRLEFQKLETVGELVDTDALVLYQKSRTIPNIGTVFQTMAGLLAQVGKTMRVLHLSDEFGSDDIRFYESPGVSHVFRNYARPDIPAAAAAKVQILPLGPASGRVAAPEAAPSFADRPHVWSFVGSMDRPGRTEALEALAGVTPHCLKTKASWDSPYVAQGAEYVELLRASKFVPCLRGSCALESFRLYEALEHGAIPFFVSAESAHGFVDEYAQVLGTHPILGFGSWQEAAAMLPQLVANPAVMETHRQTLQTWWAKKKQELQTACRA